MNLCFVLLCAALVLSACSSNQPGTKVNGNISDLENAPFDQLQTVRVMLSVVTDKVDQAEFRQTVLEEFAKIGVVHTPDNTSVEKVLAAQEKPFAILAISLKEVATDDYEKTFPVISFASRLFEESQLALNKMPVMGNVWEKINYIQLSSDQRATTQSINAQIRNLVREFSESYYQVNAKAVRPAFYIGNDIK